MRQPERLHPILVLGNDALGGAYVLRIHVSQDLTIRFGQFRGGVAIRVPRGEYLYVGSALARKGAASLPHRLIRHATRGGGKPHHRIRGNLIRRFQTLNLLPLTFTAPHAKKLRWNVDYLLDREEAEIVAVIALRTAKPVEKELARLIASNPRAIPLERGLGAHDDPGATHLFRVPDDQSWWEWRLEEIAASSDAMNERGSSENVSRRSGARTRPDAPV